MDIYYIYAYVRKSDGTPYYIGKGKNRRAWTKHGRMPLPKDKSRIIIMESGLSEVGAFALERRYIRWYGRKDLNTGILRNLTEGGEGSSGRIVDDEMRTSISKRMRGNNNAKGTVLSDDHKNAVRKSRTGSKDSDETRDKKSKARIGTLNPMYGVHRFGEMSPMYGKTHSEETREKIRLSRIGRNPGNKGKKATQFSCQYCNKNIGGKFNWTRHTNNHLVQSIT